MKKVLLVLCAAILILTGCTSSTAKKMMEATKLSVAEGDYVAALNYSEFAIQEGCKDEEFLRLVEILKNYIDAQAQLESGNIKDAKALLDKTGDTDGSGMTQAIENLKKEIKTEEIKIEELEAEEEKRNEIYKKIVKVENAFDVGEYRTVLSDAQELLDNEELTDEQKSHIQSLLGQARERLDAASEHVVSEVTDYPKGKAMLTEQEAVEVAKSQITITPSSKVKVTLEGTKYLIYVETDNGDWTDETSCRVDALTGEISDLAG